MSNTLTLSAGLFLASTLHGPVALASGGQGTRVDFDHAQSCVTVFHATGHPSALRINGQGACPKGTLSWDSGGRVSGTLAVDMKSFETGISMRDSHMKEKYLEVRKYPDSKLAITELIVPENTAATAQVPFKGNLTLHGETRPVTGTATVQKTGDTAKVHADFGLKISDYRIAVPTFAGITMADEVAMAVDGVAPLTGGSK